MEAARATGNAAVARGDYAAAAAAYRRALEEGVGASGVDKAALHSNLSLALLRLGRAAEALAHAEKCTQLRPDWSKGHFRKGEAQFAQKDYRAAKASYERAAALSPEDAHLRKRVADANEAVRGFFFRQLVPGRDFCLQPGNIIEQQVFGAAKQMKNFVYLVGDAATRECIVVDAAWDAKGIQKVVENSGMKLVGAVVTHYHFDHTGGRPPPPFDALGIVVDGVREFAAAGLPVYIHTDDAETVVRNNGVTRAQMRVQRDGSELRVGNITLRFIHTPGHTPGSQCVYIAPRAGADTGLLLSGDTLFIGSCGRLDLPDCNPTAMYISLQEKLAILPDDTVVYPGHDYGGSSTTIRKERERGYLKPVSKTQWQAMHKL
eukprot:jgi/Chlat1/8501/Chrsp80S07889